MKKRCVLKVLAALSMEVCLLGSFVGCGKAEDFTQDIMQAVLEENEVAKAASETGEQSQNETEFEASERKKVNVSLTGTITMAGSTSMEKLANVLAESFMIKYPGVTVTVEFTGSSAGVGAMLSGSVDIGISSRNLNDEEKSSGAVENIVAIDGIAVITDASNTAKDLSTEQLVGIYTGAIRNWRDVGGEDEVIVVIGREAGCGTRDSFEELLGVRDNCTYANVLNSTGAVMAGVAATHGAIGYVSMDVLDDTVRTLSLDGIEPTEENIRAGRYLFCRPFVMATDGEVSAQSEAVREMFAYLKSEEGQELIRAVGLNVPD